MTQDELSVIDGGKCILQLREGWPFFSEKFDITKHLRYEYPADADRSFRFIAGVPPKKAIFFDIGYDSGVVQGTVH